MTKENFPLKNMYHITDVIPLTRIPLTKQQFFSYETDKIIPLGTRVSVQLFNRTVTGIVLSQREKTRKKLPYKLKKILTEYTDEGVTEKQLDLARFISQKYFCPIGIVLKNFLPAKSKRSNWQVVQEEEILKKSTSIKKNHTHTRRTDPQKKALQKISKDKSSKPYILMTGHDDEKIILFDRIKKILDDDPKSQILLLVPTITQIPIIKEQIIQMIEDDQIILLHSKISDSIFYQNWHSIKNNTVKIIIGTSISLTAPFQNLKLIIVYNAHNNAYKKWDAAPRYDARTLAAESAKIYDAQIIFTSSAPTVYNFHTAHKNKHIIQITEKESPQLCTIIDMKKERWGKNYSPLSRELKIKIKNVVAKKHHVILFVNRQGMNCFSICEKCKQVLRCPTCQRALVYDSTGIYKCLHCVYKTSIFPTCTSCNHTVFKNIGVGTQKIEREISKIFPTVKTYRVDSGTMRNKDAHEELYIAVKNETPTIFIGTEQIIPLCAMPNVALAVIVDAENLFTPPDFLTNENAFAIMRQIITHTKTHNKNKHSEVLIQTFHPENKIIKNATENNYDIFYSNETKERKALFLPPYGKIIKLTFKNKSLQKIDKETEILYKRLLEVTTDNSDIQIFMPRKPFVNNTRGIHRKDIIIKYKKTTQKDIPANLYTEIANMKDGWIIDNEPVNLT